MRSWIVLLLTTGVVLGSLVLLSPDAEVNFVNSESSLQRAPQKLLPLLGKAPEFTLTDSTGKIFSSQELTGKVWLASFFFTRCPATCPRINSAISKLVDRFSEDSDVKFVSISVDPEYDSPAVLSGYKKKYTNHNSWHFLTGSESKVSSMIDGFKLINAEMAEMHTTRLALVDSNGNVRGFYRGLDSDSLKLVPGAIKTLTDKLHKNN